MRKTHTRAPAPFLTDGVVHHTIDSIMVSRQNTARNIGYTWDDYRSWHDGQRWEILAGEAYAMTPAPSTRHQKLQSRLTRRLEEFLDGKPCDVYPAPTDVKLSDDDILQPDLSIVCDLDQVKPTHIEGAPTLVVEILSPSTALLDRTEKMRLYARSAVREVWLVTPYPWLAEVFVLDGDCYKLAAAYSREDTLTSPTLDGLTIDLRPVFDYPIPPEEQIDMVKEGHPPYASKS